MTSRISRKNMHSIANLFSLNSLKDLIIENCEEIVTIKDIDLRYVSCNKAFLSLLGLKDQVNVIDKKISEIFYDPNSNIFNCNSAIIKRSMDSKSFVFDEEKLAFTYMNAGFVGYYDNHNGADDALTMSVFEIYDDRVEISK